MGAGNNNEQFGPQNKLAQELQALQNQQKHPLGQSTGLLGGLADVGNFVLSGLGDVAQGSKDYKDPAGAQKRELTKSIAQQFTQLPEAEALEGPQRQLFLKFAQGGDVDEMQQVLAGAKSTAKEKDRLKLIEAGKLAISEFGNTLRPGIRAFAEANLESNPGAALELVNKYGGIAKTEADQKLTNQKQATEAELKDLETNPKYGLHREFDAALSIFQNPAFGNEQLEGGVSQISKLPGISKEQARLFVQFRNKAQAGGLKLSAGFFGNKNDVASKEQALQSITAQVFPTQQSLSDFQDFQQRRRSLGAVRQSIDVEQSQLSRFAKPAQQAVSGAPAAKTVKIRSKKNGLVKEFPIDSPQAKKAAGNPNFEIVK